MKNISVSLAILLISGCAALTKKPSPGASSVSETSKASEKIEVKKYPDEAEFSVPCQYEGREFSVEFKSKSGKLENNDLSVAVKFDEETSVPVKIAPALYRRADASGSFRSFCEGIPAYPVDGAEQALLFLNVDQKVEQKPTHPETTVVLIDLKSKRVLNKLERIGPLKPIDGPHYTVIPAPNGLQVRLLRDPKTGAEDWKWIIVKKATITSKWMRSSKNSKEY